VFAALVHWLARQAPRALAAAVAQALATGALGAVLRPATPRGAPGVAAATDARPNLLLVVIDTLRADHLGCYGYGRPTSPVLDRLAAEGILFEWAFAQSSWTKPSTASLLTGRCPSQHQTSSEASRLPASETTIAERVRPRGYRTAAISGNPWIGAEYGFDQGIDEFVSISDERFVRLTLFMPVLRRVSQLAGGRMRLYNRVKYAVLGTPSTTARDVQLVDEALRWLERHRDERFFLYLHLMSPHHPYDPPAPFDRFVPDRTRRPVTNYPRKTYRFFDGGEPLSSDDLADMVARYDGDILFADTEVGRLLGGLSRLGLDATTAVVVTSDHGEEFFDHGNWGHGQSVHNELVRVPLIVRAPGATSGARVVRHVGHDAIAPTLVELARAGDAAGGCNLLHAPDACPDPLAELLYRYGAARALVRDARKLVDVREGNQHRRALYDLTLDPAERQSLPVDTPDALALADALAHRLDLASRDRSHASSASVDEDTRRRLRDLGYAQ
jgi:arylsulfatase A-like enzyme